MSQILTVILTLLTIGNLEDTLAFLNRLTQGDIVSTVYWFFFFLFFGLPILASRTLNRRYVHCWIEIDKKQLSIDDNRQTNTKTGISSEIEKIVALPNGSVRIYTGKGMNQLRLLLFPVSEKRNFLSEIKTECPSVPVIKKTNKSLCFKIVVLCLLNLVVISIKTIYLQMILKAFPNQSVPPALDPFFSNKYDYLVIFPCLVVVSIRLALESYGYSFGEALFRRAKAKS